MKRLPELFFCVVIGLTGCGDGDGGGSGSSSGSSSSSSSTSSSTSSSGGVLEATFDSIQSNIFTPVCSGCHDAGHPTGLDLREGMSYALLVGVPSFQVSAINRVEPGDPDNSYLIQKLEGTASSGSQMPLGGPYLSNGQIAVIRQWISDGAIEMSSAVNPDSLTVAAVSPSDKATISSVPAYIAVVLNQTVDASLVNSESVQLLSSGGDGSFIEGNETVISTVSVGVSQKNPRLILINAGHKPLPADTYRLVVKGSGDIQIANIAGAVLDGDDDGNAGGDFISEFTVSTP